MDYQPAVTQRAGIGRYTKVLADELLKSKAVEDSLEFFYLDFFRRAKCDLPREVQRPCRVMPGAVLGKLWKYVGVPRFDWLSGGYDVFHFTNFLARPISKGRSVVTIFDMSFERFPEFAERKNLANLREGIHHTAKVADAIITISNFSAEEIAEFLPEARGKIFPIPLGISPSFRRASEDKIAEFREKTGIVRPYILAVGTIEPRKNLKFLVDLFERMDGDSALDDIDLVIVGGAGWKCEDIFARFTESRRCERIHYLRYIPDGLLEAAYSGAVGVMVPSFYEGFGFPPLEAMACETPVLSSSGGSLPEVLGDGAVVLPNYDFAGWLAALSRVRDAEFRGALVRRGVMQAAKYRWENTARETWRVYRDEAGRGM